MIDAPAGEVRTLDVEGASLHVRLVGPEGAPPLLVLHGGPGEAHDVLRPHLDAIAPLRRVIYADQRGSGRSPLAPGAALPGFRDLVADVDRLREHLGVATVDVLGFSWGALLAALYARDHLDRVARLVLVAPVPVPRLDARASSVLAAPDARDVAARFAARVRPALHRVEALAALTPVEVDPLVARAVTASLADAGDLATIGAALRAVPTLVVHGREDPVSAPVAPAWGAAIGAACVAIAGSGHAPFVEAPGAFLAAVRAHLAAPPAPRGIPGGTP